MTDTILFRTIASSSRRGPQAAEILIVLCGDGKFIIKALLDIRRHSVGVLRRFCTLRAIPCSSS